MKVDCKRHEDSMEPQGRNPGFRYVYDIYRFSDGGDVMVARSYVDEPHSAHFLRIERNGKMLPLTKEDLRSPLFLLSKQYLEEIGRSKLEWLSREENGYSHVPDIGGD